MTSRRATQCPDTADVSSRTPVQQMSSEARAGPLNQPAVKLDLGTALLTQSLLSRRGRGHCSDSQTSGSCLTRWSRRPGLALRQACLHSKPIVPGMGPTLPNPAMGVREPRPNRRTCGTVVDNSQGSEASRRVQTPVPPLTSAVTQSKGHKLTSASRL